MIVGLIVSQLTLIGLMGIKQATGQATFLTPLPFATLVFNYYCKRAFARKSAFLPLDEARELDQKYLNEPPSADVKSPTGKTTLSDPFLGNESGSTQNDILSGHVPSETEVDESVEEHKVPDYLPPCLHAPPSVQVDPGSVAINAKRPIEVQNASS